MKVIPREAKSVRASVCIGTPNQWRAMGMMQFLQPMDTEGKTDDDTVLAAFPGSARCKVSKDQICCVTGALLRRHVISQQSQDWTCV